MGCVFCEIIRGERKAYRIYEDDEVIVILDINPVSKGHCLVISKKHYANIFDAPEDILSRMIAVAKRISIVLRDRLDTKGVNIIMANNPEAGQTVMHVHIHVIPRYPNDDIRFRFRIKKMSEKEFEELASMLKQSSIVYLDQ